MLYRALVSPLLEYFEQFWFLHLRKEIVELEKEQAKAAEMIKGIGKLPYGQWLKMLELQFEYEKAD